MQCSVQPHSARLRPARSRVAVGLLALVVLASAAPRAAAADFIRGDANTDGRITTADIRLCATALFIAQFWPCQDVFDVDDSGVHDIVDVVRLFEAVFGGDFTIPPPFPAPGPDPTNDSSECSIYDLVPAPVTDDVVEIGAVTAMPGETIGVPIRVASDVYLESFQIAIRYDPTRFTPLRPPEGDAPDEEGLFALMFGGAGLEDVLSSTLLRPDILGWVDDPDTGTLVIGILPSLIRPSSLDPGELSTAFRIPGLVSPSAPAGSAIPISFTEASSPVGMLATEMSEWGPSRIPGTLRDGAIAVAQPPRFIRGDSNLDGRADISDALHMVGFLFLGGPGFTCRDAADADDNGVHELSDSMRLLNHLFRGGPPPSAPWPGCGPDPDDVEDGIDCERYPGCE